MSKLFICFSLALMMLIGGTVSVEAQGTTAIKGMVNNLKGEPLPGATVTIESTPLVTTTLFNGMYEIIIPAYYFNKQVVVVVNCAGYQRKQATVTCEGKPMFLDFNLKEDIGTAP